MILVIGSSEDPVIHRVVDALRRARASLALVDQARPERYRVLAELASSRYRVLGEGCTGSRPVSAVFLRHMITGPEPWRVRAGAALHADLNWMLLGCRCPVVNPPANACSNYSKGYQVGLLAQAGFTIPRTLVTNDPAAAARFFEECQRQVILKGVSNVPTYAQRLTPELLPRLSFLPNCPSLLQEYIPGADYRVHVVGQRTFTTRLHARDTDYRRALRRDEEISVEAAELPDEVLRRCVAVTAQLGLVVSGIDFKGNDDGRLVVLELNPFPQFTFYEGRSGQGITSSIVDYLVQDQVAESEIFA